MKSRRNRLILLFVICMTAMACLLTACGFGTKKPSETGEQTDGNQPIETAAPSELEAKQEAWYHTYVTLSNTQGKEPVSYEEWLETLKGENGLTPSIGENGNWWIGNTDTGIPAIGPQGPQGEKGDTGAQGPQGEKGDRGVGIAEFSVTSEGKLRIMFTDGTATILDWPVAAPETMPSVEAEPETVPSIETETDLEETETPDVPYEDDVNENIPYKFYFMQGAIGKNLFATTEVQGDNKYIITDVDPKNGTDFYAEKVEGGRKFYTFIDGVKMYLHARTEPQGNGQFYKFIGYAAESDNVWYYKADCNAWFVTIDKIEYVIGTYSSYETVSISKGTFMTPDNTGVTLFPLLLMEKEKAESMTPSEPPADEEKSIADFNVIASAQPDKGAATVAKYIVTGKITEIINTTYGNMYIKDEEGNQLYIYGSYNEDGTVRFDRLVPQPKVGDTITVVGVACNYNGPQMMNGWIIGTDATIKSIAVGSNDRLVDGYDGWTDTFVAPEGAKYVFYWVEDEYNGELRVNDEAVTMPYTVTLAVGEAFDFSLWTKNWTTDRITFGILKLPEDGTALSIAEFKEIAACFRENYSTEKYLVTGTITEVDTYYSRLYIHDAEGNTLLINETRDVTGSVRLEDMNPIPAVGDTVTVLGMAGYGEGMISGRIQALTPPPVHGILKFTTENRTEFSTDKQVWSAEGITLIADKASSATDFGDYCDPARFYKGSELTISFPQMTRLAITCSDARYASALALTAVNVGTVTVNDCVVTVEFETAVDQVQFTNLSNQVRIVSLVV